jgi:endogenous inhibitor of DNA gyrase (YacG/DUF329 family)
MSQNPPKNATKNQPACPVCGKPATAEFRPFCSKRCKDVDLHRWLAGVYRIETTEVPTEDENPPEPEPES